MIPSSISLNAKSTELVLKVPDFLFDMTTGIQQRHVIELRDLLFSFEAKNTPLSKKVHIALRHD